MKYRFLAISLLIHAFLFLILSCQGTSNEKQDSPPPSGGAPQYDKILPKTVEVDMVEPALPAEPNPQVPKPVPSAALRDCKDSNWYGGVGIETEFFDGGRISEVYAGYPAARGGLESGDLILTVDGKSGGGEDLIRGAPGTTVTITVTRSGETLTFVLTREKICTDPGKR